jgi:YVTN family beta-propeller protein
MRHQLAALCVVAPALSSTVQAAADRVFVPLGSENAIVVIDAATDAVVGRIEGLPAAHGLAATPGGQFLVVGSYEVRSPNGGLPDKPAGVSVDEHAAHHTEQAPSSTWADTVSTVSLVSTATWEVVRRIDVQGAVHHVAVSPDGAMAIVTHPDQGTISAIDLEGYELLGTVPTGPLPNYAVFGRDSRIIHVSNAGNGTVSEVDTTHWFSRRNISVGNSPEHVVLSPDGATLYVNNVNDGTVSVLDLDRGEAVKTIPVGEVPHGIDLSDDGRTLFVAVMGEDKLTAIDLATGTYRSTRLSPAPYHLTAIRGRGKLYVSSADEPKIWIVSEKDLAVVGEIPIGGKGHQMAVLHGPTN